MNGSRQLRTMFLCVLVVSAALVALAAPAAAHDTNTEEGYDVMFGGSDEPIITGERQWFEIHVTDAESGDSIEDAELTVTVQQSGAEETYEVDAEGRHGEPGWYEAAIYFTEPGDYAVTIEGTIDGTEISTTFQKEVDTPDDLEYPESEGDEAAAEQADEDGDDEASSALGTGFGAVAGLVAFGALGAVFLLRRD